MIDHLDHLDHLVLTTSHEAQCIDFYTRLLGMKLETFSAANAAAAQAGPAIATCAIPI